jgi:hypothetical protein
VTTTRFHLWDDHGLAEKLPESFRVMGSVRLRPDGVNEVRNIGPETVAIRFQHSYKWRPVPHRDGDIDGSRVSQWIDASQEAAKLNPKALEFYASDQEGGMDIWHLPPDQWPQWVDQWISSGRATPEQAEALRSGKVSTQDTHGPATMAYRELFRDSLEDTVRKEAALFDAAIAAYSGEPRIDRPVALSHAVRVGGLLEENGHPMPATTRKGIHAAPYMYLRHGGNLFNKIMRLPAEDVPFYKLIHNLNIAKAHARDAQAFKPWIASPSFYGRAARYDPLIVGRNLWLRQLVSLVRMGVRDILVWNPDEDPFAAESLEWMASAEVAEHIEMAESVRSLVLTDEPTSPYASLLAKNDYALTMFRRERGPESRL